MEGPVGSKKQGKKGLVSIMARSVSSIYNDELDELEERFHGRTIFKKRPAYSE